MTFVVFCNSGYGQAPDMRIVYLSSESGEPLGYNGNIELLNSVFNPSGWEHLYYESIDTSGLFSNETCLLFLEGSYSTFSDLTDFYNDYYYEIEQYVFNGGHLFVNMYSAGNIFLGFDSINKIDNGFGSIYGYHDDDSLNSFFFGPLYPITNPLVGIYGGFGPQAGYGTFSGSDYDVYLFDLTEQSFGGDTSAYREIAIGKIFGLGELIFANLTIGNWVDYTATYKNLRTNILWKLAPCLHAENDIGALALITPANSCNLTAEESLNILVHNFGFADQGTFDLSFQIDGGAIITESFTENLSAYLSDTISFVATADFSECGAHEIKVWTNLLSDTTYQNDTLIYTVTNICASESTIGLPNEICYLSDPIIANPEIGGGYWEGLGIIDGDLGVLDPEIIGAGNDAVISYTYQTAIDYTRQIIPFEPPVFTDSTIISLILNDDVDTVVLPFDFVFFSNSYDVCYPASNGYIAFGEPHDTWYISIPDVGGINNLLALAGYDLDPATGGSIYYLITGSFPYRQIQLRYNDVPLSISPDHFIDVTTVLYETTNIIDIFVDKLPDVGALGFVQGISNIDGTQYYYTKTTGTPVWFIGANDTAFRFIPTLCPRTIIDTIHIVGNDTEDVLGQDTLFCFGDSVELLSNTSSSYYLWNTGDTTQSIFVDETGLYTIELEYISGCNIIDTINVIELDSIILNISSTPTDTDVNTGTATVEVISGGVAPYTYHWDTGEITSTIENLIAGIYVVEVTDSFGCKTTASVAVDKNVSIGDFETYNLLTIFPNPATNSFGVKLNSNVYEANCELTNLDGKAIFKSKINSANFEINTSQFVRGVYFLIIRTNSGNYFSKVVLQ